MSETIRIYDKYRREVDIKSIECVIGEGNYSMIYRRGEDKPLMVSQTLKLMHSRLPGFIRIHKGTLINPAHIIGSDIVKNRESKVYFSNDRVLFVSRRFAAEVMLHLALPVLPKPPAINPKSVPC